MQFKTTRRRFVAALAGIAAGLGIGFPAMAQATPAVVAPPAPAELPLIPSDSGFYAKSESMMVIAKALPATRTELSSFHLVARDGEVAKWTHVATIEEDLGAYVVGIMGVSDDARGKMSLLSLGTSSSVESAPSPIYEFLVPPGHLDFNYCNLIPVRIQKGLSLMARLSTYGNEGEAEADCRILVACDTGDPVSPNDEYWDKWEDDEDGKQEDDEVDAEDAVL